MSIVFIALFVASWKVVKIFDTLQNKAAKIKSHPKSRRKWKSRWNLLKWWSWLSKCVQYTFFTLCVRFLFVKIVSEMNAVNTNKTQMSSPKDENAITFKIKLQLNVVFNTIFNVLFSCLPNTKMPESSCSIGCQKTFPKKRKYEFQSWAIMTRAFHSETFWRMQDFMFVVNCERFITRSFSVFSLDFLAKMSSLGCYGLDMNNVDHFNAVPMLFFRVSHIFNFNQCCFFNTKSQNALKTIEMWEETGRQGFECKFNERNGRNFCNVFIVVISFSFYCCLTHDQSLCNF